MATTAQIVPQRDALSTMVDMLTKLKPQMRAALPKHLSPERMARLVTTTLRRTPRLLDCTPISLAGAIIQSCQLGLEPDGFLGEFYLTPRRVHGVWTVVGIPGYRGLMKLARQSGDVDWIVAHVVYQGDEIHYEYGAAPHLIHKPGPGPHEDTLITHAYAVARLRTSSTLFWAMRRADIDKVRDTYAAARDDGPWITHYPEMAMKTPVRRLCKFLPQSPALGRAISLDEAAEAGLPQGLEALVDTDDLALPKSPSTLDRIGDALEKATTPPAAGRGTGPSAEGPASHTPAPSSPTPPTSRRTPERRGRPGRFPRIPEDVERAITIHTAEGSQTVSLDEAAAAVDAVPDDAPHVFPPLEVGVSLPEATDVLKVGAALPEVTTANVYELLKAATTETALGRTIEHVHTSALYQSWGEPQRQIFRDATTLAGKRLRRPA